MQQENPVDAEAGIEPQAQNEADIHPALEQRAPENPIAEQAIMNEDALEIARS